MLNIRFLKMVILVIFISILALAVPLRLQAASKVPSSEIIGVPANVSCTGGGNPLVPMIYNIPGTAYLIGTMVVDGIGIVDAWDEVDTNEVTTGFYGFVPPPFDVPSGTHITDTITTYNTANPADGISYQCILVYECGTGTQVSLNCVDFGYKPPSVEAAPVPGCDMLMQIPSTAVVGRFVADSEVYWTPGEVTAGPVILPAGKTAWVLGVDSSGKYYRIVWSCDYLWVRVETMGPNDDNTWQSRPLPTGVIN